MDLIPSIISVIHNTENGRQRGNCLHRGLQQVHGGAASWSQSDGSRLGDAVCLGSYYRDGEILLLENHIIHESLCFGKVATGRKMALIGVLGLRTDGE